MLRRTAAGFGLIAGAMTFALAPAAYAQDSTNAPAVFRYETPPPHFNALAASDAELARYGLPARPSLSAHSKLAYATWARVMAAAKTPIEPVVIATGRRHGPPKPALLAMPGTTASSVTTNWAGQAILGGGLEFGASSFNEVLAQWAVSAVQQAIGSCSGTDVSATWIGIDGADASVNAARGFTEIV